MKPIIQYIETTGSYPGSGSRRKWSVFGQEDHRTANVNPDHFSAAPDYFKSYPDPGPNGRYLFFWQIKTLRDAPGKRKILSIQFFCHSDIYTNAKLYTNSVYFKKGKDRAPVERKQKQFRAGNARQILSDPDPDLHTLNWDSVLYLVGKRTKATTPI